jgi:membrane protease YdiL (CAAX protease family)
MKLWIFYSILPGGIIYYSTLYAENSMIQDLIFTFILILMSLTAFIGKKNIESRRSIEIALSMVAIYFIFTIVINKASLNQFYPIIISVYISFFEEVLYRGRLFSFLKRQHYGVFLASIIVSLIFGLMHFNVDAVIYYFVKSMLYCYLTYTLKSILPSFVIHAMNNISFYVK